MRENVLQYFPNFGWLCGILLLLSLLVTATPAFPQAASPDTTITAALSNLGDRAGAVFAGEVTAIRALGGVVEIDFRVDQAIKGQSSGIVVLREWSGLWAAGQRRYWIGERAVIFLNQPGPNGLSSSVDGMEGILPLTSGAVDVQRIRARVLRAEGAPMVASADTITLAALTTAVVGIRNPGHLPILKPRPILPQPIAVDPVADQAGIPQPSRPTPTRPISTFREQMDVPE